MIRDLRILRAQVERDAAYAQSLHDSVMHEHPSAPITDAQRVAYFCKSAGVDPAVLDGAIAEERAMRMGRAAA